MEQDYNPNNIQKIWGLSDGYEANIKIVLSNGQEAGKTLNSLTAESVKLNREIKKLEIGSDEWVKKTGEFKKINTELKDIKKEVYETEKAQGLLNSTLMDMVPFNAQIKQFTGRYNDLSKGIKGTTIATNLFSKALLATGIGAIIIALGTLFTWLSKTQQGMDFVAKAGSAINATFNVVIDRVLKFASAMNDLVNFRFGKAIEGLKDTFSGLGAEIIEESAAAYKLTGALQEIGREEDKLRLKRSQARADIEAQKLIAEDETRSIKDRASAAQKALGMEQDLLKESIALQERKLNAIKSENELGTSNDEDIRREIDAEIELNNLREESTTKQIELNNKLNSLNKADREAAQAAVNEQIEKQREADEKALQERTEWNRKILEADKKLQDQRVSMITDEQDRRIAEINLAADREIAAFEGTDAQKTEFMILKQQERDAAIEAVVVENNKKAAENNLARLQKEEDEKEAFINARFYEGLITEEERNEQLYELQKSFIEKRLALLVASGNTETLEYQKLYTGLAKLNADYEEEKTKKKEEEEKTRQQLEKDSLQAASDVFGGIAELLSADEKSRRKNFAVIKALKLAELKISYIQQLAGIWEASEKNPANILFPGASQIIAMVKTVAATARFAAGAVQISSAKFADGGVVKGPSHERGGVPFSVRGHGGYEMEGDEIILTKGVYRDPVLRAIASDLNAMGGGRRFALGGPVLDRGEYRTKPDISSITNNSVNPVDMRETNTYLRQIAESSVVIAENTEISAKTPPPISLQKVRDGLNQLHQVENEARF